MMRTQAGTVASSSGGFEIRKLTQRGSIDSVVAKASRVAESPGARRSLVMIGASSRSMMSAERSSWARRFPFGRRGSAGAGKASSTA